MLELLSKTLGPFAAALLTAGVALGQGAQDSPRPPLRFEVADIQPAKAFDEIKAEFLPGGRVDVRNIPLKWTIAAVYKVPGSLVVGPNWLGSANFNIVAKAAPTSTRDELFEMTRTLLAERFRMAIHKDTKVIPVYALVAAKSRLKLTPSQASTQFDCPPAKAVPGPHQPPGMIHRACSGATMSDLAAVLPLLASPYLDGLPVVDRTELAGTYDFQLDWMSRAAYSKSVAVNQGLAPNDGFTLTIFDALESLGLRLVNRKCPVDSIVVDSIERTPTEN